MSGAQVTIHRERTKTMIVPLLLGGVYAIGVLAFILLWGRVQYLPGFAGYEDYGLLYAALCLGGAVSNFEIVQYRRWGVWGQIAVWLATAAANLILQRPLGADMGVALVIIAFWSFDIYRHRHELR